MVTQRTTIKNPTGLHLRPAGLFCKTAVQFKSKITFQFKDTTANAKSVLSVLGACIKRGDEIELICEGEDEQEALEAIADSAIERNIGARGLRAVMEGLLTRIMYDIPSDTTITQVTITEDCVKNGAEPVVQRDDEKAVRRAKLKTGKTESNSSAPAS